tara:strand:- start:2771 stop:3187 length:417 start_codon:yes stop_codon:yes gene_type:complete
MPSITTTLEVEVIINYDVTPSRRSKYMEYPDEPPTIDTIDAELYYKNDKTSGTTTDFTKFLDLDDYVIRDIEAAIEEEDTPMRLTKQHFQLIADTIKATNLAHEDRVELAEEFQRELKKTNPQFDKEKFLEACGVEVS